MKVPPPNWRTGASRRVRSVPTTSGLERRGPDSLFEKKRMSHLETWSRHRARHAGCCRIANRAEWREHAYGDEKGSGRALTKVPFQRGVMSGQALQWSGSRVIQTSRHPDYQGASSHSASNRASGRSGLASIHEAIEELVTASFDCLFINADADGPGISPTRVSAVFARLRRRLQHGYSPRALSSKTSWSLKTTARAVFSRACCRLPSLR